MTRGRHHNTAHLVADTTDDARAQWVETFTRDRADLGPAHARIAALGAIEQHGTQAPSPSRSSEETCEPGRSSNQRRQRERPATSPGRSGPGR